MNFLSAMLRDEGGLEYKASIADTIITIIEENPEAKETGNTNLSFAPSLSVYQNYEIASLQQCFTSETIIAVDNE